jgi:hypothetical protein
MRNLQRKKTYIGLGLIRDGMNPYGNQSSGHSTWHFLMEIYNLPLWLLTKKNFIALTLLIPSKNAPTSDTIDVFLIPLERDLKKL